MIKKLRTLYPGLITEKKKQRHDQYLWYKTEDNMSFGIPKTELNEQDLLILSTIFSVEKNEILPLSKREQIWYDLIFKEQAPTTEKDHLYRYVYFSLSHEPSDLSDLKEAIYAMYERKPAVLFLTRTCGLIIEEMTNEQETVSFTEISEVLVSDFLIDLYFFIGPYVKEKNKANLYYTWMQRYFNHVFKVGTNRVFTYITAVPYIVTALTDPKDQRFLVEAILKTTIKDDDLLKTIEMYVINNSNVSLTAKKLYMHRNSVQYRIDKFIEKTGVDVKEFCGAVAIYFILIIKRKLEQR